MGRHSGNSALTIPFSPPVIQVTLEKKIGCSYFKVFCNLNPNEYYVGVLSMILFLFPFLTKEKSMLKNNLFKISIYSTIQNKKSF